MHTHTHAHAHMHACMHTHTQGKETYLITLSSLFMCVFFLACFLFCILCCEQLLQKEKSKRLGAKRDFEEIQQKAFFADINWEDLYNRKVQPPYNPNVVSSQLVRFVHLKEQEPNFVWQ